MIELDGSIGGGSVLRQSLALSILTGNPFRIINIRSGRPNPGLAPQHLAAVNLAKDICGAEVKGHVIGSQEIFFSPGEIKHGKYNVDIGTAGSITLLLQSVILPCVFSKKKISFNIKGGSDVSWSQPFDYFRSVFLPHLKKYADIEANLFKRGYYPKGGGEVKVVIDSTTSLEDNPMSIMLMKQNNLFQIRGVSHASSDLENAQVAERQRSNAELFLKKLDVPFSIKNEYSNTLSIGSGITLWGVFGDDEIDQDNPVILGSDALGKRDVKAEVVGKEAAEKLIETISSGAAVDEYLADQLIPLMGLVGGIIKTNKITDHLKANIHLTEKFTGSKFIIDDNEKVISCELKK